MFYINKLSDIILYTSSRKCLDGDEYFFMGNLFEYPVNFR